MNTVIKGTKTIAEYKRVREDMENLQYYQAEAEARRQLDTALKQEAQTRERNRTHDRDRGI